MLIVGLKIVEVKKYTESHEWVELDGNVGKSKLLFLPVHQHANRMIQYPQFPFPPSKLQYIVFLGTNCLLFQQRLA